MTRPRPPRGDRSSARRETEIRQSARKNQGMILLRLSDSLGVVNSVGLVATRKSTSKSCMVTKCCPVNSRRYSISFCSNSRRTGAILISWARVPIMTMGNCFGVGSASLTGAGIVDSTLAIRLGLIKEGSNLFRQQSHQKDYYRSEEQQSAHVGEAVLRPVGK